MLSEGIYTRLGIASSKLYQLHLDIYLKIFVCVYITYFLYIYPVPLSTVRALVLFVYVESRNV